MSYRQSRLFYLSTLLCMTAQWGCGGGRSRPAAEVASPKPTELAVKAEAVERRQWVVTVSVSGNLRSQSVVDVKAEVSGRLTAVRFREGDFVRSDDLLA